MWVVKGDEVSILMPWEKLTCQSLVAQLSSPYFRYQKKKITIVYESYWLFKKMDSSVKKGGVHKFIIWITPKIYHQLSPDGFKEFCRIHFHQSYHLLLINTNWRCEITILSVPIITSLKRESEQKGWKQNPEAVAGKLFKNQLCDSKCYKIWREIMCSIQNMLCSSLPLKNLSLSHQKVAANMLFYFSASEYMCI